MLSLGLHSDILPQVALNTKDGRQLPFSIGLPLTEAGLSKFAADFLGERLPPPATLLHMSEEGGEGGDAGAEGGTVSTSDVVELSAQSFERVAMDSRKDVLVQLYREDGCEPCAHMIVYYNK